MRLFALSTAATCSFSLDSIIFADSQFAFATFAIILLAASIIIGIQGLGQIKQNATKYVDNERY